MKNGYILLPTGLLLCGLAVWGMVHWGLVPWDQAREPRIPEDRGLGTQEKPNTHPDHPASQAPKASESGTGQVRLPTGPDWNPKNPWFKTRGIGRRTRPPQGAVLFPDGTWLPALNGVKKAPPFPGFSPGYPYAPVISIQTADDGIQWYIHADGTRSAPQNMKYGEGGKTLGTRPGWAVGNPYEKKPVVGPDGRTHYEERKTGKPKVRTHPGG